MLYDNYAAGYNVKDALKKGDIWQIGVEIGVSSECTIDLLRRFWFIVYRWLCSRATTYFFGVADFWRNFFDDLFSTYILHMENICGIYNYADDNTLSCVSKDPCEIQRTL